MSSQLHREEAFTLIEILIVVTIIGLLTAFVASNLLGESTEAQKQIAAGQIEKLSSTLELYRLDNGRYPTTDQGLEALVREPTIEPAPRRYRQGGYVKRRDINDPWSATFEYEAPGRVNTRGYDLCSYGPDGAPGQDSPDSDDICNYEREDRR